MGRKMKGQQRWNCPTCKKSWLTDTYGAQQHFVDCKKNPPKKGRKKP